MKFYRAVVEDNHDSTETSKVRVRIFGLHTKNNENSSDNFNYISSEHLPWAEVMGGTGFGLTGGIGLSSVLPQGTWVWVILNEDNPNKPIIIGTIIGNSKMRTKYSEGEGFNDKDEINPFDARTDESDFNRLGRGAKLDTIAYDSPVSVYSSQDTIHKIINDNLDNQTSITDNTTGADVSQTEPNSTNNNTTYPNCQVIETPGGHVIEYDDTPNNKRIRTYHSSGSYIEIRDDGTFVQKSVAATGESHYIHMADVQEHIAGSVKKYIETNLDEIIAGAVKRNIKSTLNEHIEGVMTLTVDGDVINVMGANLSFSVQGDSTFDVQGNTIITAAKIHANSPIVELGQNAVDAVIKGDAFKTYFDTHQHTGNMGAPTSPPISPMPSATLSTVVKTE